MLAFPKHQIKCLTLFIAGVFFLSGVLSQTKISLSGGLSDVSHGLQISDNKHFISDAETGKPVFILATTVWNINALTYSEIDTLLQSVAADGFNAIMFTFDFFPQAAEENVYGNKAFVGADKATLNQAYFSYCDSIVYKCAGMGIYVMLYTMWSGKNAGTMNTYSEEQLYTLGNEIGKRFKKQRNVILVAGGESTPPYIDTARVNAMGAGLKAGSGGNNLIAVHPCSPHSSSEFFSGTSWMDFYMTQAKSNLNGITYDLTRQVTKDYEHAIKKPTMVAGHRYESGTREDPVIQRRSLYLSVFAGAFGYAYGHNALWQMTPHTAQSWMLKSWAPGVDNWKQALHTVAAGQLHYIRILLDGYPYFQRIPDQNLIHSGQGDSINNKVQAMRDGTAGHNDATFIIAYVSSFRGRGKDYLQKTLFRKVP